jgi:hypothetical protein
MLTPLCSADYTVGCHEKSGVTTSNLEFCDLSFQFNKPDEWVTDLKERLFYFIIERQKLS